MTNYDHSDDGHVHGPGCNHAPPQKPAKRAPKPGRNEPCWCGNGKKYKKCHALTDS